MQDDLTMILEQLRALKPELAERFGVTAFHVFGSRARGDATPDSDIDVLVDFSPESRPTLFSLARLDRVLEAALGVKVDVIPRTCLNPRLAPYIRTELVSV